VYVLCCVCVCVCVCCVCCGGMVTPAPCLVATQQQHPHTTHATHPTPTRHNTTEHKTQHTQHTLTFLLMYIVCVGFCVYSIVLHKGESTHIQYMSIHHECNMHCAFPVLCAERGVGRHLAARQTVGVTRWVFDGRGLSNTHWVTCRVW